MTVSSRSSLALTDKVQYLPGVGPRRAAHLERLGVRTVGDLLAYVPMRHERHDSRLIENLEEGTTATIVGQISAIQQRRGRRGVTVSATITDNTGRCSLRWFSGAWVADKLSRGMIVRVTGKVREFNRLAEMVNPRFVVLNEDAAPADESAPTKFEGVYPATAELPSRMIERLIVANLDTMLALVEEWHSPAFLNERKLSGRRWALRTMHKPLREREVAEARRRLAYDELLLMQLAVSLARRRRASGATSSVLVCTAEIDRRIRRRFPFPLTPAQDRAVGAIVSDLRRDQAMNRMLQGDVGCGKTVVALYAALVAVANRHQVAIMAPTELLAEQHYRSIQQYLDGSRVRYALLLGRQSVAQKREKLSLIERGEMDLVVGTHALIQKGVQFAKLGLVVVDEQHRFGVRQRATIRDKATAPHYLVMTATPIPRTLAMTVFGDLDITTIDELPPGRVGIDTAVVGPTHQQRTWDFIQNRVSAGEQAYVVYPLIDESDKLELRAATQEYERLRKQVFSGARVGLLHGRMKADERDAVMQAFIAGSVDILVATTVIEVGIDVPNATCMVIEHAERYGLSQLHQLRGRIGRGRKKGFCFLMADSFGALENERLNVLAGTTDGFRIAEEDLRIRGPGEMLGTRQHGLPELRVADLLSDGELLRMAQQDATRIVQEDPQLRGDDNSRLRNALTDMYGDTIGFINVG